MAAWCLTAKRPASTGGGEEQLANLEPVTPRWQGWQGHNRRSRPAMKVGLARQAAAPLRTAGDELHCCKMSERGY